MGTGDWNDGMNLVGAGGKGRASGWRGFMVDVLRGWGNVRTRGPDGSQHDV